MPPKKGTKRGKKVAREVPIASTATSVASSESVAEKSNPTRISGSEANSSEAKSVGSKFEAMQAELLRYQHRFGDQVWEDHVGEVRTEETRAPRGPAVEVRARYPPPPPPYAPVGVRASYPPQDQAQGPAISYWEALRHMRDMGTEMFGGESIPLVADNWRKKLERNLDTARCPAEYRLDLAVQYLKDSALYWWEGVVDGVQGHYALTWEDFKHEFSKKYFPREAMDEMERAFQDLRQGSRTIREYEMEFSRLRRFAGRYYSEQDLIQRFMRGMRVEIRTRCSLRDFSCMTDLVERAALQEAGLAEEQRQSRDSTPMTMREGDNRRKGASESQPVVRSGKDPKCFKCDQWGHKGTDCPLGEVTLECWNCGGRGHIARFCRQPQREQQGANPPANQDRDNLPPPPKRQAIGR